MSAPLSTGEVWTVPGVLTVVSLVGLVGALLTESAWDVAWSLAIGLPLVVAARHWWLGGTRR